MKKLKPLESIFKKRKYSTIDEIPEFLRKTIHLTTGENISHRAKIPANSTKILPAILTKKQTVVGDLIPYTSWGSSLANLLTRDSWNKLRWPLITAHNNVCELCGNRLNSLEVHEVWSYAFPPAAVMKKASSEIVFGTQTLDGLLALCSDCHRCFHLGRERSQGTLDITLKRLAALNNWTDLEIDDYYNTVLSRWEITSKIHWNLDLSTLEHPDGFLSIKSPWEIHPKVGQGRMLTRNSDFGDTNLTILLNTDWKIEGTDEIQKAIALAS